MSVILQGSQLRDIAIGRKASKASGAISGDPTISAFTVTGGDVLITALWLNVTTAISTNGGTLAVQGNPDTGDTQTIVTATDLGTTDTAAGSVVGLTRGTTAASAFLRGGTVDLGAVVTTGAIELVGASSVNGAVTLNVLWVPLSDGAALVAA